MRPIARFVMLTMLGTQLLITPTVIHARAQAATGTLCVILYADANRNGLRDAGETGLPDVNLSLANSNGAIVSNAITTSTTAQCFDNLPAQTQFTLKVDSPLYMQLEDKPFVFTLDGGERIEHEFGIVDRPSDSTSTQPIAIPLTTTSRLLLSTVSALVVMGFMSGLGLLIYGLFIFPRRAKAPVANQTIQTQTNNSFR